MDPLASINSNASLVGILSSGSTAPTYGLLSSEISLSTPGLFSNASTFVGISARGQLLSAAVAFQNRMQALKPGTATSGGGQNFGTDLASLAAEAQSFVDSFNALQERGADINTTPNLPSGGVSGAAELLRSLDTQAQASFANGNSTLNKLAQLGIEFQPSVFPGNGGKLSLDLDKLEAAFNSDAAGAFALLSKAADAFSGVADSFIRESGSQFASVGSLQSSLGFSLFADSLGNQTQFDSNLSNLLNSGLLTGSPNIRQVFAALNEYTMVSKLFG
ncbi:MAG TPA: flagellar filament capping protein FliD [Sideroxyarcus sp.]|nr:flagellar filament capping protein FliD [Sideroxyarcus sp.]